MNQKQLLIFVSLLFSVIIILVIITKSRESDIYSEIKSANLSQIENVRFFKDGLRNEGGSQNLPITEEADLKEFLQLLQSMQPSNESLKTLTTVSLYRIQFTLKVEDEKLITVNIYRCEQTGDLGIISISQGDALSFSGGIYESVELLKWLEEMKTRKDFEDIGGNY